MPARRGHLACATYRVRAKRDLRIHPEHKPQTPSRRSDDQFKYVKAPSFGRGLAIAQKHTSQSVVKTTRQASAVKISSKRMPQPQPLHPPRPKPRLSCNQSKTTPSNKRSSSPCKHPRRRMTPSDTLLARNAKTLRQANPSRCRSHRPDKIGASRRRTTACPQRLHAGE